MRRSTKALLANLIVFTFIAIQISCDRAQEQTTAHLATRQTPLALQPRAASTPVKIDNFTFRPKDLIVSVGTTVTWTNADDVPHTATHRDDPPVFDSGAIDTDETFSFTFTKAGTYSYYCKVHPHMSGTIVVK